MINERERTMFEKIDEKKKKINKKRPLSSNTVKSIWEKLI